MKQAIRTLGPLAAWIGSLALVAAAAPQESGTTDEPSAVGETRGSAVEMTRDALERWVETRRLISRERQDWTLGREVLEDRIAMVQGEIASLRERIAAAEDGIHETDDKRAELEQRNESLRADAEALSERVVGLETRTRRLLPRLPDPLRERVRPLSQRFPANPGGTQASLSERYQNVVGILNAVNDFQGQICVASEVLALADGTSAEVAALYVGIGKGYYVTADDGAAGVGDAHAGTWGWTPADASAAEIRRAIQIMENTEPAAFVSLPLGAVAPAALPAADASGEEEE